MSDDRLKRTKSSALWSAYADALGFPTELASEKAVQQRLGLSAVTRTQSWRRLVGGRFGATVKLPAGAYSDDTQLRLATCRAIRGNGYFDVEAFAKIELPVWLAYALGAGRGSKAAATALCNRGNTWFSNFFQGYVSGGGNGAAMRVQPHVWAAANLNDNASYLSDVIRNAVCTHGHMRGIAGAVAHAVSLAYALKVGRQPSPEQWIGFADDIRAIPRLIADDSDLTTFWVPTWEQKSGQALQEAVAVVANEWENSSRNVISMLKSRDSKDPTLLYGDIVKSENGLSDAERGSGIKSALFANVAAWICQSAGALSGIQVVANLLGSDTDTIGTMAGAIVGAVYPEACFLGPVQDESYICSEAERLYEISQGKDTCSFSYPDMLYWQPPRSMVDVLRKKDNHLHFEGLGDVDPVGEAFSAGQKGASWQWFLLPCGQTVLSKFRTELMAGEPVTADLHVDTRDLFDQVVESGNQFEKVSADAAPFSRTFLQSASEARPVGSAIEEALPQLTSLREVNSGPTPTQNDQDDFRPIEIDILTSEAIKGFDPNTIGRHILMLAEQPNGIELSIAYSAIVVKARAARLKHSKK